MSEYIHKSHNVTVLIYHYVCPAKYRRIVFDEDVEAVLKEVCKDIELRYEKRFLEIGADKDHVHFLVQAVPKLSPTQTHYDNKKYNRKRNIQKKPSSKKELVGRTILDRWIFC